MGNSTISMAIFNSYVKLPEGKIRKKALQFLPIWAPNHPNPSKIECILMKQSTAISDLFILGSLLGYFTHTNFLGCFKGKLTGTPCFFPPLSSSGTVFPIHEAHMFMALVVHFANNTHTHTIIGIPKNPNSGKKQHPSGSLRYTLPTTDSHNFVWVNSPIRTWYQRVPRPIPKDWKARIRSRASTFDFSSLRLLRATRTTRSRPGRAAIWKAGSPRKSI